jgi:hypothetical protein
MQNNPINIIIPSYIPLLLYLFNPLKSISYYSFPFNSIFYSYLSWILNIPNYIQIMLYIYDILSFWGTLCIYTAGLPLFVIFVLGVYIVPGACRLCLVLIWVCNAGYDWYAFPHGHLYNLDWF